MTLKSLARITDSLEHYWENVVMKRAAGNVLVVTYLALILVIEFNRQGWLPARLAESLPHSHFFAVQFTFTLLLITEVVSLVFGLSRSFSRSVGIQLEILSLILLRDTFKKFTEFAEPLEWSSVNTSILDMAAEAGGALLIFVIIGIYYRIQESRAITSDEQEQDTFIAYKKIIALGLLITFSTIGVVDATRAIIGLPIFPFFESFYTILIFTDVLMVLLSLRFGSSYAVTFRNFGFSIVTVFIRLALIAPIPINVGIGIGTALFALLMAYAYKVFGVDIIKQMEDDHKQMEEDHQKLLAADGTD